MKSLHFCILIIALNSSGYADDILLKDGRLFKNAAVVGETPADVTLRYTTGLVKVPKAALPDKLRETLAEPQKKAELIEKETNAQLASLRQISAERSLYSSDLSWSMHVGIAGDKLVFCFSSGYLDSRTDKSRSSIELENQEMAQFNVIMQKFADWHALAEKENIPTMEKEIGIVGTDSFKFSRSDGRSYIYGRHALFVPLDVTEFEALSLQLPSMKAEMLAKAEKTKHLADFK